MRVVLFSGPDLDSSEKFALGGPYGVRTYATNEAMGDRGGFASAELRYAIGGSGITATSTGELKRPGAVTSPARQSRISGSGSGCRRDSGFESLSVTAGLRVLVFILIPFFATIVL